MSEQATQGTTQHSVSGGRIRTVPRSSAQPARKLKLKHQAPKFSKAQLRRQRLEELDRRKRPRLF